MRRSGFRLLIPTLFILCIAILQPVLAEDDSWGDAGAGLPEIWCPNCEMWEAMDIQNPPRVRNGKLELYFVPMNRWEPSALTEIRVDLQGDRAFIYSNHYKCQTNPAGLAARNIPLGVLPPEVRTLVNVQGKGGQ